MLSSVAGNSKRITKKALCVLMTISLSLMMLPSALFRTEAHAAPAGDNPLNLEDNHFGEFVYDTSNSANKVVYDDKTILQKVASLQETDTSIVESATASLKASLIENKYSMIDENLPQAEEGYKITATSIASITSQLACVVPTKVANTDKWEFAISNPPSGSTTGDLLIKASLATYNANFLIAFDKGFVPTQEIKYEFNYAGSKGLVKLNASGKTNDKGNALTLVSVEAQVKSIATTDIKYGVSVKLGEAPADHNIDSQPVVNDLPGPVFKSVEEITNAVVEGRGISQVALKDGVIANEYSFGFVSTIGNYIGTPSFDDSTLLISIEQFLKASIDTLAFEITATEIQTNEVKDKAKITIKKISPKEIPADVSTITLPMREKTDQQSYARDAINELESVGTTIDGKKLNLFVANADEPLNTYSLSWDENISVSINTQKIKLIKEGTGETSDYVATFDTDKDKVLISAPSSSDLSSTTIVYDDKEKINLGDDPEYPFKKSDLYFKSEDGYLLSNKDKIDFTDKSFNPNLESKTGMLYMTSIYVKNIETKIITKFEQNLMAYEKFPYVDYKIMNPEDGRYGDIDEGNIFENIINGIKFFFSGSNVKIRFKYIKPDWEKNVANAKIVDKDGKVLFDKESLIPDMTDLNYIYFNLELPKEDFSSYENDITEWWILPISVRGQERHRLSCSVIPNDNTEAEYIVAQAPAPYNISYSWSTNEGAIDPLVANQHVVFDSKVNKVIMKASVKMTNPVPSDDVISASDLFKYTKSYWSASDDTNVIATIYSERQGKIVEPQGDINKYKLKYSDFEPEKNDPDIWSASIEIDLNYLGDSRLEDNITLEVNKIQDLLERTSQNGEKENKTFSFSIDNSAPVLTVDWQGAAAVNHSDALDKDFYTSRDGRSAIITIEDMNFGENGSASSLKSLIDVEQFYVDEVWNPETHTRFGEIKNEWTQDGKYKHYIVVSFKNQGDYRLEVSGTDTGGNEIVGDLVPSETGKYISETFCQDFTPPILHINWDNMNVVNGKYYTGGRNVTFTVEERNFNPNYVFFNGSNVSWTQQGQSGTARNVHTFSQSYQSEGDFSIVLTGEDWAKQAFNPYSDEFTIDWTKPNIQISGVENRQAYGDTAQPNVTITDANMAESTTCQVESLGATKGHPYSASPATSRTNYTYSYGNPEAVPDNDGVYRINVNAVDMAGNADVQERVWSVNRFGSTYVIDAETDTIMDGYVNKDSIKDIVVTEINPSGTDSHSIDMTKGSFTETLNEGTDYTANASGGDGSWYECVYTISKDFFKEDGKYTLSYYSKDKAGHENENTMENKNVDRNSAVNVQFMYDNAKPSVFYNNLSESMYSEATHKATAVFEDNSNKFSEAKVIINGDENYVSGDDLEKHDKKIDFELKDSGTPYTIETVSFDKAGNEMDKDVKTVVVTMNPFLLWFYNTPLFVGSLVGGGVVIAAVGFFLYRRKHLG